MKLINLKNVPDYKVQKWLENSIRELTPFQKEWMRNDEIVRSAPFDFYERGKRTKNPIVRISIVPYLIVGLLLFIGLPFNFLFTGNWGYKSKSLKWFTKWSNALSINI